MRKRAWLVLLPALAGACRGSEDHEEAPTQQGCPGIAAGPVLGRELDAFAFLDPQGRQVAWDPANGLQIDSGQPQVLDALVTHAFQPDCPACRQQAIELEGLRARARERTAIVGVAHRPAGDLRGFADDTHAKYPLVQGGGTDWAERWGRGDALYIVDRTGTIAYTQVGFHASDVARWQDVLEDLGAGRVARHSGPERDVLVADENLSEIELPLIDGTASARIGLDDHDLLVLEQAGQQRRFRAAVGFFSRY